MAEPEEEAEEEAEEEKAVERTPEELPRVPCHIFLPVVPAARVIGKQGANIKAIREQSGASVRVLQKELPHEMQRREDRVAVITGDTAAVQEAISGVLERVFDRSGLPDTVEGAARDRDYIVEVLVPEKSGSHLIGQKGDRVKALCQETRCDIRVGQDPVCGLAEQKKVRISATTMPDAAAAIWRLLEVLGELMAGGVLKTEHFELREASQGMPFNAPMRSATRDQKEVPVRLLIAKEDAAWIVGKRGNKIARLRDWAKVNMVDADAPPFDPSERVLEISAASLESRVKVVQMVAEDLARDGPGKLRLLVPTELFGSVMGHRGETLRSIIQSSKAQVQQHKAEHLEDGDYRFRLMDIKGSVSQRVDVVRQVHSALEQRGREGRDATGLTGGSALMDLGVGLAGALSSARASPGPSGLASGLAGLGPGGGGLGLGLGVSSDLGTLTLQLAMPNEEVARLLANDSSGIARRAGVKLSSTRGAGGLPVLKVAGTAVANSVACYLIQDRIFMMH
ncbi:unnamed protein product [Effrenium voratum]|nr:unnamed protein product [Effrenium voratum]